jgi:predicted phage-related endonuclease
LITKEQKEERRRFIGSSDITALFTHPETGQSLDPFKTAADVVASKIYDFEPEKENSENIKSGIRWEPYIIAWAGEQLGVSIETNPDKLRFIDKEHLDNNGDPVFACNLDGFFFDKKYIIVEAKKTRWWKEWGSQDTDDIPMRVILQCHHQMLCTGWDEAVVAAMIQGDEKLFKVYRDEEIINRIIEQGLHYWHNYILPKVMPEETLPGNIEMFKRIVRQPEKLAEVDNNLILKWEAMKQARLEMEKAEEKAFGEVLVKLGDAEGVNLTDGRQFTYFKQTRSSIDSKKLKAEYPDVYSACQKENSYRVARITKG